jgi:hypothetical protein
VDVHGAATRWGYLFYSPSRDRARAYSVRDGRIVAAQDLGAHMPAPPVHPGWIDSDAARRAADAEAVHVFGRRSTVEVATMLLARGASGSHLVDRRLPRARRTRAVRDCRCDHRRRAPLVEGLNMRLPFRAIALSCLMLMPGAVRAEDAPPAPMAAEAVRLQRAKPEHERLETLRFFRANRDFIRGRLDRLQQRAADVSQDPSAMDPRFLDYAHLLGAVANASDSLTRGEAARQQRGLLGSVTDLGLLEAQLDQMGRMLDAQRAGLGALQADFDQHQQTAMLVVVSGDPGANAVGGITLHLEDGDTLTVPLDEAARATLRAGGILELFHGLIEPRAQVVEVGLTGTLWPAHDSGYLTLEPARDQLLCVRFDLAALDASRGAGSIVASTWTRPGSAVAAGTRE